VKSPNEFGIEGEDTNNALFDERNVGPDTYTVSQKTARTFSNIVTWRRIIGF